MTDTNPKQTAVRLAFFDGFEATVRIEPELVDHMKAVKLVLEVLGGEVVQVRKARKQP